MVNSAANSQEKRTDPPEAGKPPASVGKYSMNTVDGADHPNPTNPAGMPTTPLDVRVATVFQNAAKRRANMGWGDKFLAFFHGLTKGVSWKNRKNHWALAQAAEKAKMQLSEVIAQTPQHLAEVPGEGLKIFFNALNGNQKAEFLLQAKNQIQAKIENFQSVYTLPEGSGETTGGSRATPRDLAKTFFHNAQFLLSKGKEQFFTPEGKNDFTALGEQIGNIFQLIREPSLYILPPYEMNLSTGKNVTAFKQLCGVISKCQDQSIQLTEGQMKKLATLANTKPEAFSKFGDTIYFFLEILDSDQVEKLAELAEKQPEIFDKFHNVREACGPLMLLSQDQMQSFADLVTKERTTALESLANMLNRCNELGINLNYIQLETLTYLADEKPNILAKLPDILDLLTGDQMTKLINLTSVSNLRDPEKLEKLEKLVNILEQLKHIEKSPNEEQVTRLMELDSSELDTMKLSLSEQKS